MILPSNHTLMFMCYLFAEPVIQDTLRPMMGIMTDPECTPRQRYVAYNYIDSHLTKHAKNK